MVLQVPPSSACAFSPCPHARATEVPGLGGKTALGPPRPCLRQGLGCPGEHMRHMRSHELLSVANLLVGPHRSTNSIIIVLSTDAGELELPLRIGSGELVWCSFHDLPIPCLTLLRAPVEVDFNGEVTADHEGYCERDGLLALQLSSCDPRYLRLASISATSIRP